MLVHMVPKYDENNERLIVYNGLFTWSSAKNSQNIRKIFAKYLQKICEIFAKNTRKIYEKFAKNSQKNCEKSKFANFS